MTKARKKINWKRPVETECGIRLKVQKPGYVLGLPADPSVGRRAGEKMNWRYNDEGSGGMPFLPRIRNVPFVE